MSDTIKKRVGLGTAYGFAKAGGYEGTVEQFTELLGNIAIDLARIENLSVTVTTLPAGSQATASLNGSVLSLGIPKGDKGDKGNTGNTPDFDIGTVTTLSAGSSATASITGTAENPVLNLGIPEGQAGSGAVGTVASAYSSSSTYAVGDYAIHNSNLYRCTTAITTAEAFTAAHWTQVVLADDVSDLKSELSDNVDEQRMVERGTIDVGSVNYYNPQKEISGKRVYVDGTLYDSPTATTSDYISIPYFATYIKACCSWNNTSENYRFNSSRIAFYDGAKTFISPVYDDQLTALAIPVGAKYVRVSYGSGGYRKVTFGTDNSLPAYTEYGDAPTNIALVALDNYNPQISQNNLTFAEAVKPTNLFDYSNEEMRKDKYWYYSTSVGATVSVQGNQYTNEYSALKIPVTEEEKVTLNFVPMVSDGTKLYWIGAVNSDMKLLSYQTYNNVLPYTFTIPSGTAYVLCSIYAPVSFDVLKTLVIASGTSVTEYSPYFEPYYILKDCMAEQTKGADLSAKIKAPDSYSLVVGDTFELFFKGIIQAVDPYIYNIEASCPIGNVFKRKYVVTPTSSGTYTLNIKVKDYADNVLAQKDISLIVNAKATSPSEQKNILCVGDSLTANGSWVKELHRRLTANSGTPMGDNLSNINFIGTKVADGVHYEGYGGWTFYNYNTSSMGNNAKVITCTHDKTADDQHSIYQDSNGSKWKLETIENGQIKILFVSGNSGTFPASGTLIWVSGGVNHSNIVYTASTNASGNPFWNDSLSKVDFATYATNQGVNSIDYVYVLLGWNNASSTESSYKSEAQTFIDNVQASFPNAKIILIGLEIPSKDGLGVNYDTNSLYSKYWELMQYVFNLDEWYEELADDNTNVYHINLSGQFDTEYNMITMQTTPNTRNNTVITMQSNGVHPATSGEMQIADAVYRDITPRL